MRLRTDRILALVSLASLLTIGAQAEVTGPRFGERETIRPVAWTPVLLKTTDAPRAFRGSDGKYNLVYDILLTNYNRHSSKIKSINVLGNGQILRSLTDKDLLDNLMVIDGNKDAELGPGESGVVWMNISFDKREDVPNELIHQITFESTNALDNNETFSYKAAPLTVDSRPPVLLGPPLKGGKWFAYGGYASHAGHRTALFPINNDLLAGQRFAIDWILLDKNNTAYKNDGKANDDWFCYGQLALAVANGTVCGVIDKFPDQPPFKPEGNDRLSYPAGNCVVIDLGDGYYGAYAHLKPGSIRVKPGDIVKRGDQLALVGNSGNTTGAHLHFHIIDAPEVLTGHGVPYAFDKFDLNGEIADIALSDKNMDAGIPQVVSTSRFDGEHKVELPKSGTLVVFPQ